jgi:hypothetical protein
VNVRGRHPNVLLGLLLGIVAVLVVIAVQGLGTPAAQPPDATIGLETPVAPVSATSTPPAVIPEGPVAPELPAMIEIAPGVMADCGRIGRVACEAAIALARAGNEADIVGTTLVVVDDVCAPDVLCDRQFPFDVIVIFVTAGGDTTGWYAFHVTGAGDLPTRAERWEDEIPAHVVDRIRAALDTA